jgi:PKD repeat protein
MKIHPFSDKQIRPTSPWLTAIVSLIGVLFLGAFLAAAAFFKSTAAEGPTTSLYLPLVVQIVPFNPTGDTQLNGGQYTFSSINIPAGITVTLTGNVTIQVLADTAIAGNVVGDCTALALTGQGNVTITGSIDNRCIAETESPAALTIHTTAGSLALGTTSAPAHLHSSGDVDVSNAPDLPEWEFDVLPDQRSDVPLPPVCAARADTLVTSVTPGYPAEISFVGEGADPDGGPVMYAWDFGGGVTVAERNPVYSFTVWGTYPITLTVTDNEDATCQATLHLTLDDGETNLPEAPALWAAPTDLVVEAGQPADFSALALDPQGQELTYWWDFGDAITSTLPSPTHTYTLPGRYPVTLTVTDFEGYSASASGSIYVYATPTINHELPQSPAQGNCLVPGPNVFNIVFDGGAAGAGRDGRRLVYRGRGDIFLGGATDIHAQDGGAGVSRVGAGTVLGGNGGRGGSLQILVNGHLIICGGATLAAGNGGNGGNATSLTPPTGLALARGGNGGGAAPLLRIAATQALEFQSPLGGTVLLKPGNGGDGGWADATGQDGASQCPVGQAAASAKAIGGDGGKASKAAIVTGALVGLASAEIDGGNGGDGGIALAAAGNGGNATCPGTATGGLGKPATARGGQGGEAKLTGMAAAFVVAPTAFTAGDGGSAEASGGDGGMATATPPAACADATAVGGQAGAANATGGNGGKGRIPGNGGDADALGGEGGAATATGGDCTACGNGGAANATGGRAGNSDARYGKRGGAAAADGSATSYAYDGGDATATGGRGGDCPTCPGGKGGDGGPATASGGQGGTATGNGLNDGGAGGDGDAAGGSGGDGANCCEKFNEQPGGNGGNATSTAGSPGAPGGVDGGNGIKGGDGGNGGNGLPPGAKGLHGVGSGTPLDIPDGVDGLDGAECPPWIIWFIYHSSIPDGTIVPGTTIALTVYPTNTTTVPPVGVVPTHFLTPEEFGAPTQYIKDDNWLNIQAGGIRYDLAQIPPTFPVTSAQAQVEDGCGTENCIQLIGYYQGDVVGQAGSQAGMGVETLQLPPPPVGIPYYDSFLLVGYGPFRFDHWWIVIIDP